MDLIILGKNLLVNPFTSNEECLMQVLILRRKILIATVKCDIEVTLVVIKSLLIYCFSGKFKKNRSDNFVLKPI